MARRMLIDPEQWEDVASDLGLGVHYWCRDLTGVEQTLLTSGFRLPDMYTVRCMAIDPNNGQDDRLLLMTRRDYEWALSQIEFLMPHTTVSGYVSSAFADRDPRTGYLETTYLDAEVADAVAQLHLFNEIRYG